MVAMIIKYFFSISFLFIFVILFIVQWILFIYVNPFPITIDNKFALLSYVPIKNKPENEYLLKDITIEQMQNMKYPIIIKPLVCTGGALGVYILNSYDEFVIFVIKNEYKINISDYMVQNFLEGYDIELSVLYEKYPWQNKGKIFEISEKTQKELIRPQVDGFVKNHPELINEKVEEILENISKNIPKFYTGRYDIRLKAFEDFEKDEFKIVEINGTMGMHIVSEENMFSYDIITDSRWYFKRLLIGMYNLITLNGYNPIELPKIMLITIERFINCDDWENLFSLYS